MFRSSVTILLIISCLLTQYAKHLAYLQCKIENVTSKATTCDCEKKYSNSDENNLPVQRPHVHILLDEFYFLAENDHDVTIEHYPVCFFQQQVAFFSSYTGNIFHPPQLS